MILVDLAQIAPILKRSGCLEAVMAVVSGTPLSRVPRHVVPPGANIPHRRATDRRPHRRTVRPPASSPRATPARAVVVPRRGPRVRYVARLKLTAPAVLRLPAHDLAVYRLIRQTPSGVTRLQLLSALRAHTHTGKVDGSVRRLRLKKLITVTSLEGQE